jgi:hypothetical protein
MAFGIELEAVVGESLFPAGERREIDVGNLQSRGELADRVAVKGEVGVVDGEVFGGASAGFSNGSGETRTRRRPPSVRSPMRDS